MEKLQIKHTFLDVKDKYSFMQNFIQNNNTNWYNLVYVGDDVNDLANICTAGWSFAPANATEIIKSNADFVLNHNSANGAIREVCEWVLNYNKRF